MRFDEFERAAEAAYARIPDEYKIGIDGLRVSPEAEPHPSSPGVFTLGECVTEAYPSDWEGPETTRSVVVLYHGSFVRLARKDPSLDWEDEVWETLTHELRHHLEWLAGEDDLEGVDYAMDEEFKRWEGEPFDPWYFQAGDDLGGGAFRVERSYYLERTWSDPHEVWTDPMEVEWRGRMYRFDPPIRVVEPTSDDLPDVHFIHLDGVAVEEPGEVVELVLLRTLGWWETLKRLVGRVQPKVLESSVEVIEVRTGGPDPRSPRGVCDTMPVHDAYARLSPFELALPEDRYGPERFAEIRTEIDETDAGSVDTELGLFLGLDAVGRLLDELRKPDASQDDLRRHGVLLFHAFHFHEAGRPFFLLSTPPARFLVESRFDVDDDPLPAPTPPSPAGYLQLPRHLFWIRTDEELPPEPVDGFFWAAPGGDAISVLVAAGVRPERAGFTVLALPRLPLAHAGSWVVEEIRPDGEDYSSDLPGSELENLYSLETAGEVLKLLARAFHHLERVPGCAPRVEACHEAGKRTDRTGVAGNDAESEGTAGGPPPSVLPYRRIELTAATDES